MKTPKFKSDFRKTNPALHLLYVKWAVANLVAIDHATKKLEKQCHCSLFEAIGALVKEKSRLVKEDAAHADAYEILQISKTGKKNLAK